MTDLTPEQVQAQTQANQMRQALMQGFEALFKNLIEYLQRLQTPPNLQAFCFMNLDQAGFWARQGINNMPLTFQPPTTPAPEVKPEEGKTEEVEPVEDEQTAA